MKRCKTCGVNKKNAEFYKDPKKKDKLKSVCRPCYDAYYDEKAYIRKYNITKQQKFDMIASQNNCCSICSEPFSSTQDTHVDHCHDTGKVRAILCANCNRGIGCFKDNTFLMQQAMNYIFHYAKQNTTSSVPAGHYSKSEEHSKHGAVLASGAWEDNYDANHHRGAVYREDPDHRTEEGGGDGVAHRNKKVEPPEAPEGEQDDWELHPAYGWIERRGGRLFD